MGNAHIEHITLQTSPRQVNMSKLYFPCNCQYPTFTNLDHGAKCKWLLLCHLIHPYGPSCSLGKQDDTVPHCKHSSPSVAITALSSPPSPSQHNILQKRKFNALLFLVLGAPAGGLHQPPW
eukprot:jgi/Botrbrau1/16993/Bobra.49_2s0052.1